MASGSISTGGVAKTSKFKPSVPSTSKLNQSRGPALAPFSTSGFQTSAPTPSRQQTRQVAIDVSSDSAPPTPGLKRDSSDISILDDPEPHFSKRPRKSAASDDKENILQSTSRLNSTNDSYHSQQRSGRSPPPSRKSDPDMKSDLSKMDLEQVRNLYILALAESNRIQSECLAYLWGTDKNKDIVLLEALSGIIKQRLDAIVERKKYLESRRDTEPDFSLSTSASLPAPLSSQGRAPPARSVAAPPTREPSLIILEGPVPTPPKPSQKPVSRAQPAPSSSQSSSGGSEPFSEPPTYPPEPSISQPRSKPPLNVLPQPLAPVAPPKSTYNGASPPSSTSQSRPLAQLPFPLTTRSPTPPAPRPSPLVPNASEAALWEGLEDIVMDDVMLEESTSSSSTLAPPSSNPGDLKSKRFYPEVMEKLRQVFKLSNFRSNQLEAISATLEGKDVFVLMPTGGGKSLCYQLPALCTGGRTTGVTVVVSPLLALMKDQVQSLQNKRINALLSSSENSASDQGLLLGNNKPNLWYITPEKLKESHQVQFILKRLYERGQLARFVVDEAHCISTWGQDFREAYTELGQLRERYKNVPIMALTATANQRTRADIVQQLKLQADYSFFQQSFNRTNLHYTVLRKKHGLVNEIAETIGNKYRHMSGVIYCHSRKSCESVAQNLRNKGVSAAHFHAGMAPDEKEETARAWQADEVPVIVATIAFGMGIDKPDVRFVIHYDMPKNMSGYYQETGRAGRDGRPADCIMYFSVADLNSHIRQIDGSDGASEESKNRQKEAVREVYQFCDNLSQCRRVQVLHHFDEHFNKDDCAQGCDNCLDARLTVKTDVTTEAMAVCRLIQCITRERKEKVSRTQLSYILRGSNCQDVRQRGHESLKEFGACKGMEKGLLELMFNTLEYQEILATVSEPNSRGFHNDYLVLGSAARAFMSQRKSFMVDWYPKAASKGKSSKKKPASTVASSISAPVRGKGKRKAIVEEDPIGEFDDMYDDDDDTPFAESSSSRVLPKRSATNPSSTIDSSDFSTPSTGNTQVVDASSDSATTLYNKLLDVREQIRLELGIKDGEEVLEGETLQIISLFCPTDYKAFKRDLLNGLDDQIPNVEEVAALKWEQYGRRFLNVCIEHATSASNNKPAPQLMSPAVLHSRFEFHPMASHSTANSPSITRPPSSSGPRPKFKPS